ncbi:helix-hairpin-helix domain-containing protein [Alkalicella caledoniensis]|uniref:Helix-hairpin-helix domain-containing protein n=1 Tax=Alkalicella caledoniensis TaxID=2731377 RepID=A0A7G9W4H3_ALKCA|nr:helix-hairpin-helix domain-containing protein [Alkalicella caledoniensis]QNO13585.1 helix-hairpin-helix domain-containing protein [Alkalicella caledoniensis]
MNFTMDKDKVFIAIIIFLLVILVGGYGFLQSRTSDNLSLITDEEAAGDNKDVENQIEHYIYVHVSGNVKNSGVYKLPQGARVLHAIELAGGSSEEGDIDKLNLAQVVQDGQKIIVPSIHDETTEEQSGLQESNQGMININIATQQQLESLTGIGPAKATAIIQFREQNGPFKSIDDIQKVSGIGSATFSQIKDKIAVN